MSVETVLRNAKIVTPDQVISGSLKIAGELIQDVSSNHAGGGLDFEGDYLIPGLIESHTDNLERHLVPRPGVTWPSPLAAVISHDAAMASSGITTVLDSIYVGYTSGPKERNWRALLLDRSIKAINQAKDLALLRTDHLLHLRCEVTGSQVVQELEKYIAEDILALVSFMDHTPGQRQWTDISKWRLYHSNENWSDEEAARRLNRLQEKQAKYADKHRKQIADLAKERSIPLASHDDTLPEHVDQAHDLGVVISEFPTTLDAAKRAMALGMHVVAGTPNLVRGESHSGNISVRELARQKALDCLSSDYVPASLLHAGFILHQKLGYDLPGALSMVTSTPAKALGLHDRGSLLPGKRADLVRVKMVDELPVVRAVWAKGRQVL